MNISNNQLKVNQVVTHLQKLQSDFSSLDLQGHLAAKPIVDMDVNESDIVIFFELSKDTDVTVVFNTNYVGDELASISIENIEIDSTLDGNYSINGSDNSTLIFEGKRLIHDAVYYKLLSEDEAIETSFYSEVYA